MGMKNWLKKLQSFFRRMDEVDIDKEPNLEPPVAWQDISIQPTAKHCSFCNQELYVLKDYHCRYCRKDFCPKHRLPEQHYCKKLPKK